MRNIFSSDLLRELLAIEGRYIQWEWEPETFSNDYITLREATGYEVIADGAIGRFGSSFRVSKSALQKLIGEHSVCEDETRRASGFRIFRPTQEGRWRCELPKAS